MSRRPITNGPHKRYLGDGAYVDYDGYSLVLTAENGIEVTDEVVLEPVVYQQLLVYVGMLNEKIKGGAK